MSVASHVAPNVRDIVTAGVGSPRAIALGVLGIVALVVMVRIDWNDVIARAQTWLEARHRGRAEAGSQRPQELGTNVPGAAAVSSADSTPTPRVASPPPLSRRSDRTPTVGDPHRDRS